MMDTRRARDAARRAVRRSRAGDCHGGDAVRGRETRLPAERLTPATRAAIAERIEMLIGILDADDAPSEDLEPEDDQCEAGDDGCGFVRLGSHSGWGSAHDDEQAVPRYGHDQTEPPLNTREAGSLHRAAELGLERTPSGGWRWPR